MIANKNFSLTNKLTTYNYPCTGEPFQPDPLVLIHGWGSSSDTWHSILPELRKHLHVIALDLPGFGNNDYDEQHINFLDQRLLVTSYVDAIMRVIPTNSSLMGWSLGGAIATAMIGQYPSKLSNLITIATNPCFLRKEEWSNGMSNKLFTNFFELFKNDPSACLRNFNYLQCSGDLEEKKLSKFLKLSETKNFSSFDDLSKNNKHLLWLSALKLLGEIDNRQILASLELPSLHFFGQNDQLVNAQVADEITRLNSSHEVKVYEQKSHLLHISSAKEISSNTIDFLKENRFFLNKKKIALSFSSAATTYESVSRLQRQTGKKLLDMLPEEIKPINIVDLGCGTGYCIKSIRKKNSASKIIGLDLAEGMLKIAKSKIDYSDIWVCGDAENIPLSDNSIDIIFSNLTFQWCNQTKRLSKEIGRVLKPGGKLFFTSLGKNTLCELKKSWMKVDNYIHVNRFLDPDTLREIFFNQGIYFESYEVCNYHLKYNELSQLTRELKKLGAHNLNSGQKKVMTSKKNIRNLINAYDKYRDSDGNLTATWQVVYGVGTLGA
ncbi:MAG: malonyl-[acyl-carrier protein] O-methyltransferase BioC [Porticoccus sp.]|jgi:malonyl-CoA O-methyltransferase|nr:malonyl-[acyl-carrier protein] O-methyltransferase BioC [Porticoccus sp.]|tara:strand:- start:468 stop:2117 length:1650 start_codon:yes stop_codon:yes gene_type:complete